jgi:dihydroneopterin aldolase/2-amino-4-hydroxy-6-hydroxymethyldihydropteridine diphosphokinase
MDRISLRGVRAYGRHGANPGERDRAQPFDIDVVAEIDLRTAGASDALDDTLDYDALYRRILTAVETTSYALLERLAVDVLDAVFADHRVVRAEVSIGKPGLLDGATPSISLVRENARHR